MAQKKKTRKVLGSSSQKNWVSILFFSFPTKKHHHNQKKSFEKHRGLFTTCPTTTQDHPIEVPTSRPPAPGKTKVFPRKSGTKSSIQGVSGETIRRR